MIVTAAAAAAAVTAVAVKLAAGGVVSAAELATAHGLIAEFGLTGFDTVLTAYNGVTAGHDIKKRIQDKRDKRKQDKDA